MASTIILSDNGASSGSAGLKETGGNDGVLILQTTTSGGTATNAVTVDNLQNLSIGTSAPNAWNSAVKALQVNNAALASYTNGSNIQMWLANNAYYDNATGWLYKNASVNPAYYAQVYEGSHTWNSAPTGTAGAAITFTQVLGVNKDKTLTLQGGTSSTGTGIAFPATQSASSDANTLDDYEEGTWTPTIEFGGGSTGITYIMQNGYYTKIGRTVTVTGILYLSSKGSSTGTAFVRGLPFTNANLTNNYSGCVPYTESISFAGVPELTLVPNSTSMGVYQTDTAGTNTGLSNSNFASSGAQIRFNFVYQTST